MPAGKHGTSIKNPRVYDALRKEGMDKSKAAAISNAAYNKEQDKVKAAKKATVVKKKPAAKKLPPWMKEEMGEGEMPMEKGKPPAKKKSGK